MTYDNLTSLEGVIRTFKASGWVLHEESDTKVVFRAIVIPSVLLFLMSFMFILGVIGAGSNILLARLVAKDLEIAISLSDNGLLMVTGSTGNFSTENRFKIVPPREGVFGSRKRFNLIVLVAGLFVTMFYMALFFSPQ